MTPDRTPSDAPTPITEQGTLRAEFSNAGQCFQFAKKLDDEDRRTLSKGRRQIMAMKAGFPPWAIGSRKGNQTNLNFDEGAQALEQRRIPYLRRLTETDSIYDTDLQIPGLDPDQADDLERQLSSSASSAWKTWKGGYQQMLRIATDMIDFGLGVALWGDSSDPRFARVPRWNVFFEADAEPVVDDLRSVVIRDKWSPQQLLAAIDHPDAEKLGYQVENLRHALAWLHPKQGDKVNGESMRQEELEEDIRRNQYGATGTPNLNVYQVLFKDLETQEINVYVVAQIERPPEPGQVKGQSNEAVYLRKKPGAYKKMSNVLALFPLPSADTIQGLRGHGHRIHPKAMASSRVKSMALDNHTFETTRWFSGQSESGNMSLQARKIGPYGVMRPEITPVELPKGNHLELDSFTIGFLNEELRRSFSGNPLTRNPQTSGSPAKHRSKFQEQADLLDDNGLSDVEIGTFDFYFDALLEEFYRRLTLPLDSGPGDDLRKYFARQIEIYQVPEFIWREPGEGAMRARRSVGSGSIMDQLLRSEKLLSVAGSLGERGAHEALEYFLSILVGPRNVRRFLKTFESLGGKTEQHWMAQIETNQALEGKQILRPAGSQKDDSHLQQHIEGILPKIQEAEQGQWELQQLVEFVMGMEILLPHMDIHLARLEGDETKQAQFDQHRRAVEEVRRQVNSLRAIAQQGMEAEQARAQEEAEQAAMAQQGPQLSPEQEQKLMQAQMAHEQKQAQRDETFQRQQQERSQAHEIGEQRKDQAFARAEQRKDAGALQDDKRKTAGAMQDIRRKEVDAALERRRKSESVSDSDK